MEQKTPCNPNISCKLRDTIGCFQDVHHTYFPRRDYKSGIERAYRELPENKQRMCRSEHNNIHASEETPEKPSTEEMLRAIQEYKLGKRVLERS